MTAPVRSTPGWPRAPPRRPLMACRLLHLEGGNEGVTADVARWFGKSRIDLVASHQTSLELPTVSDRFFPRPTTLLQCNVERTLNKLYDT